MPAIGIPEFQFGFRRAHSTIQQYHRIAHTILNSLNSKEYCTAVFLNVRQTFDRVWHVGLLYKIKKHLPTFFKLLESYLNNRQFRVRIQGDVSVMLPINSDVPQGSVLGPLLYILLTSDLPLSPNITIGTFADDTVILTTHSNVLQAHHILQEYLKKSEKWLKDWSIEINETKSTHITFTLRKDVCPPITHKSHNRHQ